MVMDIKACFRLLGRQEKRASHHDLELCLLGFFQAQRRALNSSRADAAPLLPQWTRSHLHLE